MATNPILQELSGLSPGAQEALVRAHTSMGGPGGMAGAMRPPDLGTPSAPTMTGHNGASPTLSRPADPGAPPSLSAPGASAPPPMLGAPTPPSVSPMIRGTEQGDQLERHRLLSTGAGIDQIHSKIEGALPNHPKLGAALGWGAEIPLHVLEAAGSMFGPTRTAEMMLPGTTAHHAMELRNLNSQIGNESKENLQGAQAGEANARGELTNLEASELPGKTASEEALQSSETGLHNAQTAALPQENADKHNLATSEIGEHNARTNSLENPKPTSLTPERQTFDDLLKQGMSPMEAYEHIKPKTFAAPASEAGTWQLDEDKDGNPIEYNSKTGQTRPAPSAIFKPGHHEKAEQANAGTTQAQTYANDYLKRGVYTGPGDEALQEKFFELAKPSSGFRMTQPQIHMLQQSRDWMGSLEGHLRHATTGTWFSNDQRKQIVDTMNQLAAAKGLGGGSGPAGTQTFTDNGITYHIPAEHVAEFKKDHPNAR